MKTATTLTATLATALLLASFTHPEAGTLKDTGNHREDLTYGQYVITNDDMKTGKQHTVHISGSCSDSFKIYFPYGGTISTVRLCIDTPWNSQSFKHFSYMKGSKDNYMIFTQADTGRYYIRFTSCHWGGGGRLTLR